MHAMAYEEQRIWPYLGARGDARGEVWGEDIGDSLRGGTGGGTSRRCTLGDMRGEPLIGECFGCNPHHLNIKPLSVKHTTCLTCSPHPHSTHTLITIRTAYIIYVTFIMELYLLMTCTLLTMVSNVFVHNTGTELRILHLQVTGIMAET